VSGTKVRADPLGHLHLLEPCVRAHFVRRVVLIGAESTGKTTLAAGLGERFETVWVPEYGREYWERKVAGLPMDGPLPPWSSDEFVAIAAEQQRRENEHAGRANKVLLCDTNAFATGTWHERYMGNRSRSVDAIGAADKVDLYLLAEPDFPFVQDGWRDGESIRDWMHQRFLDQMQRLGKPVVRLRGPHAHRLDEAARAIEAMLHEPVDL
jgi:NadR type nicotinamide-nucleotide adenylyltransferase